MKSDAFACIMTDIDNHRVLDVARGRTGKGAETLTNKALTEGFNTTIQALKATAKGYRNFENFRTVNLFYCGKLDMRPDFVRIGSTYVIDAGRLVLPRSSTADALQDGSGKNYRK